MKFSDQKIKYYDPDKDDSVWITIPEYIRKFPDLIGVLNVAPGTNNYKSFTLPRVHDITDSPILSERMEYAHAKTAFVWLLRSTGILLEVPDDVEVNVTIDIHWPDEPIPDGYCECVNWIEGSWTELPPSRVCLYGTDNKLCADRRCTGCYGTGKPNPSEEAKQEWDKYTRGLEDA